jgi:hypothetical protein
MRILQDLFKGCHGATEIGITERFELGTREGQIQIDTTCETIHLYGGLSGAAEAALGAFTCRAETRESTIVACEAQFALALELGHAPRDQFVVEVFASQVGITARGFDFEDTIIDGNE